MKGLISGAMATIFVEAGGEEAQSKVAEVCTGEAGGFDGINRLRTGLGKGAHRTQNRKRKGAQRSAKNSGQISAALRNRRRRRTHLSLRAATLFLELQ